MTRFVKSSPLIGTILKVGIFRSTGRHAEVEDIIPRRSHYAATKIGTGGKVKGGGDAPGHSEVDWVLMA